VTVSAEVHSSKHFKEGTTDKRYNILTGVIMNIFVSRVVTLFSVIAAYERSQVASRIHSYTCQKVIMLKLKFTYAIKETWGMGSYSNCIHNPHSNIFSFV
jgi:hypothetical protein